MGTLSRGRHPGISLSGHASLHPFGPVHLFWEQNRTFGDTSLSRRDRKKLVSCVDSHSPGGKMQAPYHEPHCPQERVTADTHCTATPPPTDTRDPGAACWRAARLQQHPVAPAWIWVPGNPSSLPGSREVLSLSCLGRRRNGPSWGHACAELLPPGRWPRYAGGVSAKPAGLSETPRHIIMCGL